MSFGLAAHSALPSYSHATWFYERTFDSKRVT